MQYEETRGKAVSCGNLLENTPVVGNFSECTLVPYSYKEFSRYSYIKYLTTYQH